MRDSEAFDEVFCDAKVAFLQNDGSGSPDSPTSRQGSRGSRAQRLLQLWAASQPRARLCGIVGVGGEVFSSQAQISTNLSRHWSEVFTYKHTEDTPMQALASILPAMPPLTPSFEPASVLLPGKPQVPTDCRLRHGRPSQASPPPWLSTRPTG